MVEELYFPNAICYTSDELKKRASHEAKRYFFQQVSSPDALLKAERHASHRYPLSIHSVARRVLPTLAT